MKNLILCLLMSISAFATTSDEANIIASVPINYYDGPEDNIPGTVEVILNDNGELVLKNIEADSFFGQTEQILEEDVVIDLGEEIFDRLSSMADELSIADIDEQSFTTVCAVMPPAGVDSDLSVSIDMDFNVSYTSKTRIVLTASGCWRGWSAKPVDKDMEEMARDLKDEMTSIAVEEINQL